MPPDNHVQVLVQVGVERPEQLQVELFSFWAGGLDVADAQLRQFRGRAVLFLNGPAAGEVPVWEVVHGGRVRPHAHGPPAT